MFLLSFLIFHFIRRKIEGGCTNNNWAKWEQQKTRPDGAATVLNGEVSGAACDHYNRVSEDIGLVEQLGCNAHRMSLEWSRIEPQDGIFDAAAIEHYRSEIAQLRARNITPMLTLHHFTQPIWFDDLGGWEDSANIARFVRFCQYVLFLASIYFFVCFVLTHHCLELGACLPSIRAR